MLAEYQRCKSVLVHMIRIRVFQFLMYHVQYAAEIYQAHVHLREARAHMCTGVLLIHSSFRLISVCFKYHIWRYCVDT